MKLTKTCRKLFGLAAAAALVTYGAAAPISAEAVDVSDWSELINGILATDPEITLTNHITVPPSTIIPVLYNATINFGSYRLDGFPSTGQSLFNIAQGFKLTLNNPAFDVTGTIVAVDADTELVVNNGIIENRTGADPAIINNGGTVNISDTTIRNNQSVVLQNIDGAATLTSVTISGNGSQTSGAATVIDQQGGTISFVNPAVSGNFGKVTVPTINIANGATGTSFDVTNNTAVFSGNTGTVLKIESKAAELNTVKFRGNSGTDTIYIDGEAIFNGAEFGSNAKDGPNSSDVLVYVAGGATVNFDPSGSTSTVFQYNKGKTQVLVDAGATANFNKTRFTHTTNDADQVILNDGAIVFNGGEVSNNTPKEQCIISRGNASLKIIGTTFSNNGRGALAQTGGKLPDAVLKVTGGTADLGEGNSAATFSQNAVRALQIPSGSPAVELKNAIFSDNERGAVEMLSAAASAKLTITRAEFTGNGIDSTGLNILADKGGAINWQGGEIKFGQTEAKRFTRNYANEGGAIYISNREFTLPESAGAWNISFDENVAKNKGGAIFTDSKLTTLNGASFNANRAGDGGAIYSSSTARDALTISGGTFTYNHAGDDGQTPPAVVGDGNGGAVYADTMMLLQTGIFRDNFAKNQGGAVYVNSDAYSTTTNNALTIIGGEFTDNSAAYGGAVYAGTTSAGGGIYVTGGTFKGNSSTYHGGAIHGSGINLRGKVDQNKNTSSLIFDGNSTTDGSANGGAVYSAPASGSSRNDNISGVLFCNNSSARNGGAAYLSNPSLISNSWFYSNGAYQGGALATDVATTVDRSTFATNTATWDGGAICFPNKENQRVYHCSFIDNIANGGEGGGAIFTNTGSIAATTNTWIVRSHFQGNQAPGGEGGAVNSGGNVLGINQCSFVSNHSHDRGGGVFSIAERFGFFNSTFFDNSVDNGNDGGGLYIATNVGSNGAVVGCTFTDNNAPEGRGGGLYGSEGVTVSIGMSIFTGNAAREGRHDIYKEEADEITTLGYNVICNFGMSNGGVEEGSASWKSSGIGGTDAAKKSDFNSREGLYDAPSIFGDNTLSADVIENYNAYYYDNEKNYGKDSVNPIAGASWSGSASRIMTIALDPKSVAYSIVRASAGSTLFNSAVTRSVGPIEMRRGPDYFDARGVRRGKNSDPETANPRYPGGGTSTSSAGSWQPLDNGSTPPGGKVIYSVSISGLPNFTLRVGQTVALGATVRVVPTVGASPVADFDEKVTWGSSNSGVATIDDGILVIRGEGIAVIYAISQTDPTKVAQHTITAYLQPTDSSNMDVAVHQQINGYNDEYSRLTGTTGITMMPYRHFQETSVSGAAFTSAFNQFYGILSTLLRASDLTSANDLRTHGVGSGARGAMQQVYSPMGFSVKTLKAPGAVLGMTYTYVLDWADVAAALGSQSKGLSAQGGMELSAQDVAKLFKTYAIVFNDEDGKPVTVIDDGTNGVSAAEALSMGALSYSGGAYSSKLVLTANIFLGDASPVSGQKAANAINNFVVVGDGKPNSTINGGMWLAKSGTGTGGGGGGGGGNSGGGEGGGGGCVAGALGLALIALPIVARRRK